MALRPSKGWHGVLWLPDRMGCHNLDSERAGLCPRGGETAIDDFSVGHNLPIPVAGRTVPGDPIRKCAFLSHDDESRRSGLILPKSSPGMSVGVPSAYSLRRLPTNPMQRPGPSRLSRRKHRGPFPRNQSTFFLIANVATRLPFTRLLRRG